MMSGVIIGGIMGFFGGAVDLILSRVLEVIGNFPIFLLQLTLLAFFNQSYGILLFVMTVAGWIPYARFTRAEFFRLRNQEFVQAAEALGASRMRIFFRHLLPNSLTPILIYIPFDLSSTIVALGALSFLGFGEPINVASLGELMKQAKDHFQDAWWLAVFPGTTIFMLTLSLTVFGSGVRDALDPRQG
jgi:ABC-type dipeptide/oligopeptide/nickel transport system permease subunit